MRGLVDGWLQGIGLGYAVPIFAAQSITTPETLARLEIVDFPELGISDQGDRRKLFYLILRVRLALGHEDDPARPEAEHPPPAGSKPGSPRTRSVDATSQLADSDETEKSPRGSPTREMAPSTAVVTSESLLVDHRLRTHEKEPPGRRMREVRSLRIPVEANRESLMRRTSQRDLNPDLRTPGPARERVESWGSSPSSHEGEHSSASERAGARLAAMEDSRHRAPAAAGTAKSAAGLATNRPVMLASHHRASSRTVSSSRHRTALQYRHSSSSLSVEPDDVQEDWEIERRDAVEQAPAAREYAKAHSARGLATPPRTTTAAATRERPPAERHFSRAASDVDRGTPRHKRSGIREPVRHELASSPEHPSPPTPSRSHSRRFLTRDGSSRRALSGSDENAESRTPSPGTPCATRSPGALRSPSVARSPATSRSPGTPGAAGSRRVAPPPSTPTGYRTADRGSPSGLGARTPLQASRRAAASPSKIGIGSKAQPRTMTLERQTSNLSSPAPGRTGARSGRARAGRPAEKPARGGAAASDETHHPSARGQHRHGSSRGLAPGPEAAEEAAHDPVGDLAMRLISAHTENVRGALAAARKDMDLVSRADQDRHPRALIQYAREMEGVLGERLAAAAKLRAEVDKYVSTRRAMSASSHHERGTPKRGSGRGGRSVKA